MRGRSKLKVKQIVFVAFSRDETEMGFGFPKAERDGLVASDPETFFLPGTADLRYQWVCAHLDRLGDDEMRELVTDAWRMCTPKMLHELPELPAPTMRVWDLVERQEWHERTAAAAPLPALRRRRRVAARADPRARPPGRPPDAAAADRGRGPRRPAVPLAAMTHRTV